MNHLIFYTSTNNPTVKHPDKKDAEWAFIPEAEKLKEYLYLKNNMSRSVAVKTYRVAPDKKRGQVEAQTKPYAITYNHAYFLCHGWQHGIQFGYKYKWGAKRLVTKLIEHNSRLKSITFFCCSVASGKDNFAKWVFDELRKQSKAKSVQVFGHFTAGHTTKNPRIKIYSSDFEQPFIWGLRKNKGYNELISNDKSEAYKMIQDDNCDLRFQLPHLPMVLKENGFTWGLK